MNMKNLILSIFIPVLLIAGFSVASEARDAVVVGGKNFTEQYVLSESAKILLEKGGLEVRLKTGVGSAVIRRALMNGQIDLYYEYTGTAYNVFYKESNREIMTDPLKVYQWVAKRDAAEGLVWLEPVRFNNTYTLMMRKDDAVRLDIQTIGDLSAYVNENPDDLVFGVNAEFWERPDGFKPLMKTYGFRVPYGNIRKMESGLVYKALKEKSVDVSMGFATDGRISAFGFMILEDNKHYFPVYNPAPVVRKEVLDAHPEIREILQPLADNLDTEAMRKLNSRVDVEHEDAASAARSWLVENGLL